MSVIECNIAGPRYDLKPEQAESLIFKSRESTAFKTAVSDSHLGLAAIQSSLRDPDLQNRYDHLTKGLVDPLSSRDSFRYWYQYGILLSQLPYDKISPKNKERFNIVSSSSQYTVDLQHEKYFLCDESEERMAEAIQTGALALINDSLLFKTVGRPALLAMKSSSGEDGGTVVERCWYSFGDKEQRNGVISSMKDGANHFTIPDLHVVLMRAYQERRGNFWAASCAAERLGDRIPDLIRDAKGAVVPRGEYINTNFEPYYNNLSDHRSTLAKVMTE